MFVEGGAIEVPEPVRVEVGEALGQAGDPRLADTDENRVLIRGGRFWMGAQKTNMRGRNFDLDAVLPDEHDAEVCADQFRGREERYDFVRRGVCRDVEILGGSAEQEVVHAATDEVGLPSALFEDSGDSPG